MKGNEVRTKLSEGQEDAGRDVFDARRGVSASEHKKNKKKGE